MADCQQWKELWYNALKSQNGEEGRRCHAAAAGRRHPSADAGRGGGTKAPSGRRAPCCAGIIESGTSANLIFYGPSGTGKTTVAGIIARQTNKTLYHLNATTASLQDVKDIMADVGTMLAPNGVLLYLDEIQYFNKKQQQSLLEYMENGKITLIASTTENPYFYVYNALLSRSTVFEFKPLTAEETVPAVVRALEIVRGQSALPLSWEDAVPAAIAAGCGGDVRKASERRGAAVSGGKAGKRAVDADKGRRFTACTAQRHAL